MSASAAKVWRRELRRIGIIRLEGIFGINGPGTPLGDARQVTDNELTSVTVGFKASLTRDGFLDGWQLDGYYQYGENVQDYITENGIADGATRSHPPCAGSRMSALPCHGTAHDALRPACPI